MVPAKFNANVISVTNVLPCAATNKRNRCAKTIGSNIHNIRQLQFDDDATIVVNSPQVQQRKTDVLYRAEVRRGEKNHNKDAKKVALRSCHINPVKLDIPAQKRAELGRGAEDEEPQMVVAA